MRIFRNLWLAAVLALAGCASHPNTSLPGVTKSVDLAGQRIRASWYGGGEKLNRHTANGDVFRPGARTAAHRTLPFGTQVHVTNPATGQSTTVTITDRGPARWTGRSLDLSRRAATDIGLIRQGAGTVWTRVVGLRAKARTWVDRERGVVEAEIARLRQRAPEGR